MNAAERIYRMLLRAYPAHFRAAYGEAMVQLFRDRWRDALRLGTPLQFWLHIAADVATTVPQHRGTRLRTHRNLCVAVLLTSAVAFRGRNTAAFAPAREWPIQFAWPMSLLLGIASDAVLDLLVCTAAFIVVSGVAGRRARLSVRRVAPTVLLTIAAARFGVLLLGVVFNGASPTAFWGLQYAPVLIGLTTYVVLTRVSPRPVVGKPFSGRI